MTNLSPFFHTYYFYGYVSSSPVIKMRTNRYIPKNKSKYSSLNIGLNTKHTLTKNNIRNTNKILRLLVMFPHLFLPNL